MTYILTFGTHIQVGRAVRSVVHLTKYIRVRAVRRFRIGISKRNVRWTPPFHSPTAQVRTISIFFPASGA